MHPDVLYTLNRFTEFLGTELIPISQQTGTQQVNIGTQFFRSGNWHVHYPLDAEHDYVERTVTYSDTNITFEIDGKQFTGKYPYALSQDGSPLYDRWELDNARIEYTGQKSAFDEMMSPTPWTEQCSNQGQTKVELTFSVNTTPKIKFKMTWTKP